MVTRISYILFVLKMLLGQLSKQTKCPWLIFKKFCQRCLWRLFLRIPSGVRSRIPGKFTAFQIFDRLLQKLWKLLYKIPWICFFFRNCFLNFCWKSSFHSKFFVNIFKGLLQYFSIISTWISSGWNSRNLAIDLF